MTLALPPLPLILPPLPFIPRAVTGWIPIVDKPVRSGWYDILTVDHDIERREFDVASGRWHCISGNEPATVYTFWRGQVCQ